MKREGIHSLKVIGVIQEGVVIDQSVDELLMELETVLSGVCVA